MGKESLIKSTTSKKGKATPKKKATTKTTPQKPITRKKPPAKTTKKKKIDMKELLLKKFEKIQEPELFSPEQDSAKDTQSTSDDIKMDEASRSLLFRKYSMAEIEKAAKPPAPKVEKVPAETTSTPPVETPGPTQQECSDEPPPIPPGRDPVSRSMLYGVIGLAVILLLIIGASVSNSGKYYLVQNEDSVEIWRGRFSPMGKRFEGILHNYQLVDPVRESYSKQEIFPAIFNYYLEKADSLLNQQNPPDFQAIISQLDEAKIYAITPELIRAVDTRLSNIHRMTLIYKADVASTKNSAAELESAIKYLKGAKQYTTEPDQMQSINTKLAIIQERLKNLPPPEESDAEQKEGSPEGEDQPKE